MCRIGSDAGKDELEGQRSCRPAPQGRQTGGSEDNAVNGDGCGSFCWGFRAGFAPGARSAFWPGTGGGRGLNQACAGMRQGVPVWMDTHKQKAARRRPHSN